MSVMSHVIWIVGWLLLIVGVLLAFLEPHRGKMVLAVAGAVLIAGEHIADTIRQGKNS